VAAPKKRREETLLREYPAEARYREVLDLLIASAKEQRTEVFSRVSWGGVASIFGRRKLAWVSLHVYSGLALRLSTKKPNRWVAQTS
jgi:hypothetical protein